MASGIKAVDYFIDMDGEVTNLATIQALSDTKWSPLSPKGGTQMNFSIGAISPNESSGSQSGVYTEDFYGPGYGPSVRAGARGRGYYCIYLRLTDFAGNRSYYGETIEGTPADIKANLRLTVRAITPKPTAIVDDALTGHTTSDIDNTFTVKFKDAVSGIRIGDCWMDITYIPVTESNIPANHAAWERLEQQALTESQLTTEMNSAIGWAYSFKGTYLRGKSETPGYETVSSPGDAMATSGRIYTEFTVGFDLRALQERLNDGMRDGGYKIQVYCTTKDGAESEKTVSSSVCYFYFKAINPDINITLVSPEGTFAQYNGAEYNTPNNPYVSAANTYIAITSGEGIHKAKFRVYGKDDDGVRIYYTVGYREDWTNEDTASTSTERFNLYGYRTPSGDDKTPATELNPEYLSESTEVLLRTGGAEKDGTYTVVFYAVDAYGRSTNFTQFILIRDTTPPVLKKAVLTRTESSTEHNGEYNNKTNYFIRLTTQDE